ncbi:MAG: anaerobic ribonucleoside-triphosphate reductase activating protein [Lachnospiraceae bacterium]|jgi:pyruvate formate lyase activating enzyme|nr:anaerobic ribonucleoside-triphosphate reductase activating protein [Lachnospiraceae bacterium]
MHIGGLNKTTLLDYPEHVAATIFCGGCNFRCPFCQNSSLIVAEDPNNTLISENEALDFLEKRKNVLAAVCISGGEPTLQADLSAFVRKVKGLGYKVKLDTNGYRPEVVADLLKEDLLDYVAMDIKNTKEKYAMTAGFPHLDLAKIETAVDIIKGSAIAYEFRTTVVGELHTIDDLLAIGAWLGGGRAWFLQSYQDSENVLQRGYTAYSEAELAALVAMLHEQGVNFVQIRGS